MSSTNGVQQGDNLGPLLFAIGMHPVLEELAALKNREGAKLDIVVAFLDDVVITGDAAAVRDAYVALAQHAASIGLELNVATCELIPTSAGNTSLTPSSFASGVKWNATGNFELLGAPIGNQAFCQHYTSTNRLAKVKSLISKAE